jgi:hypothetical protein
VFALVYFLASVAMALHSFCAADRAVNGYR